jgi:hypothetical protein
MGLHVDEDGSRCDELLRFAQVGNLVNDFNFSQQPLPRLVLPLNPPPGPASTSQ